MGLQKLYNSRQDGDNLLRVVWHTSRPGGPSAPGELVEWWWPRMGSSGDYWWQRLVVSSGVEWRRIAANEWQRMVATNGFERRRMVASMDERWTQEGADMESRSGVLAALCQRTDRLFVRQQTARESSQVQYRTCVRRIGFVSFVM